MTVPDAPVKVPPDSVKPPATLISSADEVVSSLWKESDPAKKVDLQAAAMQRFESALQSLQLLQTKSPNWKPELVGFRIKYCQGKITDLKAQLASARPAVPPAPAPPSA